MLKTLWTKAKNFFLDHINWCHKTLSTGEEKPMTWFYEFWCWIFWPIPWMEEPCWCCASVRGVIYGILLGLLGNWLWRAIV